MQGNRLYKSKDTSGCSPGLFAWKRGEGGGIGRKKDLGKRLVHEKENGFTGSFSMVPYVSSPDTRVSPSSLCEIGRA